jgi:hypothetical protein
MQGSVVAQSGSPGDVAAEFLQLFSGVGGIGHDMDAAAGQRIG